MKNGTEPKFYCIYSFNNNKFKILWEYIEKNLKKGHIKPLQSSTEYPILFILKKDSKLRLYIDYYILKDFIDKIVVIYLDNIFIFNKTLEEYKEYIYLILIVLKQANLYINVYKNTFYSQEIDYLKFKIKSKTIKINDKKIKVMKY